MRSATNVEAFMGTLGAGLSTMIGAGLVIFGASRNNRFLSGSMALAAGVMIYVSMVDILGESKEKFHSYYALSLHANSEEFTSEEEHAKKAEAYSTLFSTLCFFGGVLLTVLLVKLVDLINRGIGVEEHSHDLPPSAEKDEESTHTIVANDQLLSKKPVDVEYAESDQKSKHALKWQLTRTSIVMGLAIAIHNMPEGLATFVGMKSSIVSGLPLVIAIGLHNIPEGICVAAPVYLATGSKLRAFAWGSLSGFTEPLGGLLAWLILSKSGESVESHLVNGILFGLVAGIMTCIAFSEMLPMAMRYEPQTSRTMFCMFLGMALMAVSLCLFSVADGA